MLEIDYIDPLTDPRWDAFVEKHESGWIGHLSIWKRILDENFKYLKGLYIILKDKNEIIAGLPIYYVNSWLRGKRLIHIPFCTICDPLVSSKEELDLLLKEVFSIFDKYKPKGLEIRTLNSDKYFSDAVFQKNDYYKYHYLLLDKSLDDIWKNFHRTCIKQRINRATESGMMLKISEGYDDLKKFLKLYLHTRQRLGLPPLPFKFIENLWEVFHEKNMLDIYLGYYQNKLISGLLLLKYKNKISAEIACSDPKYWNLSPNHFLFWSAIQKAHSDGFEIFDFGRTSPDNKGLMDFKKRWDSTEVNFNYFYYPIKNNNIHVKEEEKSYQIVNFLLKMAPKIILKKIGEFFYNHSC